jgi:predicted deacylase
MQIPTAPNSNFVVKPAEFEVSRFKEGAKHDVALALSPAADGIEIPVLLVRGQREGKTLVVMAGVHGDEFEGVRAVFEIYSELDPKKLDGTLIAVPVANPPAFWSAARTSPIDGCNLARAFPGLEYGSATEVIAYHLAHSVIAQADFFLDLHSAGVKLLMPSMVGYDAKDPRSSDAAMIFGAPVVWAHSEIPSGRSISFAASRNIPWLYTEARGAGRIDDEDLRMFKDGILNLLRYLGILAGDLKPKLIEHFLCGDGDLDASMRAAQRGFLLPCVHLLQRVEVGQALGHSVDVYGGTIEEFRSAKAGVIAMIHAFPIVEAGEVVFLVSEKVK